MTALHDFNTICRPLRRSLLAKATQLTRSHHAAEDLVQDAMLKAFTVWHTFAPEDNPTGRASAWLHRILLNMFRSQWRTRAYQAESVADRDAEVLAETMSAEPYESPGAMSGRSILDHVDEGIRAAVEGLEPIYKDVILRTARGEDDDAIAAELELDPRNVRHRLHRARRRVADALAELGDPLRVAG